MLHSMAITVILVVVSINFLLYSHFAEANLQCSGQADAECIKLVP